MRQVTLQGVRRSSGPVDVVKDTDPDLRHGGFPLFAAPSGCGERTTLRLAA